MAASQPATFNLQEFTDAGQLLVGGRLYTYAYGTTAQKIAYTDPAATVPHTYTADGAGGQYIALNARGELPAPLYLADGSYDLALKRADGSTVWTRKADGVESSVNTWVSQVAGAAGAALVGFTPSSPNASASLVQDKLRERVSVLDFMTKQQRDDVVGRLGSVDVTAAVQKGLDYVAGLAGGGRLYVPSGVYMVSAPLNIKANTYLYGDGWYGSKFKCTHNGDCLRSTFPINSSSAANINVKDLGAYATSGASTGAGYVDVGGTFINVENCFFQNFKFSVVLDQSELVVIDRCHLLGWGRAGIWLVNGPDHTAGANKGFTNRITITNNQFNGAGGNCILDDGGGNHLISGNNFNQGGTQVYVAGCGSLTIQNNEFEGASGYPVYMAEVTSGGAYVGPVVGFNIHGNGFGGGAVSIYMDAAHGGDISGNVFYQYGQCAFEADFGPYWRITNVSIGSNYKSLMQGSGRTDTPFFSSAAKKAQFASAGQIDQMGMTYCNQAPSVGVIISTPVSMEDITEGCLLRVMNADGTNAETIQAYNVTATTYTAQYTSSKSPGFLIFVMREQTGSTTWTPTPTGSAAGGAFTTTTCKGVYEKRDGRLHFNAQITWTANSATGQMLINMPMKAKANGLANVWPVVLTGPGAIGAGVGQIALAFASGSSNASLVYLNTTTGSWTAFQCPPTGDMYLSGSYETA